MEQRTLGRTGLSVSLAGLGCGGPSRLGLRKGLGEDHAARLVLQAIDLGINLIDTAESYGTESAVGDALAQTNRDNLIVCTKKGVRRPGPWSALAGIAPGDHHARHDARPMLRPEQLRASLEHSLRRLRTDRVDVYFLHGVLPGELDYALEHLVPELHRLRDAGLIRFIAISEMFAGDTNHAMLRAALASGAFDVLMVGFNMLNQSARHSVYGPIAQTAQRNEPSPGTLNMFSVRRALSDSEVLRRIMGELIEAGELDPALIDRDRPLGFVEDHPAVASLTQAAYRFCAHEPGVHCVLTGTSNPEHLAQNAASIAAGPLPDDLHARIVSLLGHIDSVSAQ
jgi:aryl-alcohol dehydrogenase-like predicted oxidoreductase